MITLRKDSLKQRGTAFLMAMLMIFGMMAPVSPLSTVALAADPPGSGTSKSIFDIVDSKTGGIDENSDVAKTNPDGDYSTILDRYKNIAVAIMGILTITMLIFMLLQFTKLGAAGDNEQARRKAIMGILTTGIATALLGGSTIIVGFFWGALNTTTVAP